MREETCLVPGNDPKPRVLSRQCSTCVGRPGNPMHIRPGSLKMMVSEALQQGCQGIICHQTLSYGKHKDFGGALCRWFYDTYGPQSNFIRVMWRLGGSTSVNPPSGEG